MDKLQLGGTIISAKNLSNETMSIDKNKKITRIFIMNFFKNQSKNFGYVRKSRMLAFWTIIIILLTLAVGNLLLTLSIISSLHFGKGIYGMEFIPEDDIIKFYGNTDLDRIYIKNIKHLEGYINNSVTVTAEDAAVYIRIHQRNGYNYKRLVINNLGIQFRGVNIFDMKNSVSGNTIFSTHRPHYNMPSGVNILINKLTSANRIVSPIDQSLIFSTLDTHIALHGSEGIFIDAASAILIAERNIVINSTNGALKFPNMAGIFFDTNRLPIIETQTRTGYMQYKLCICMPEGMVFRIAIPHGHNIPIISCVHFNAIDNPCEFH